MEVAADGDALAVAAVAPASVGVDDEECYDDGCDVGSRPYCRLIVIYSSLAAGVVVAAAVAVGVFAVVVVVAAVDFPLPSHPM